MKSLFLALLLLSLAAPLLPAQEAPLNADEAIAAAPRYSQEELKELVGPIALYPDPLVGLILPGSTFPSDIVLAARFVETGDDLSLVDEKPWDVSVRALTRYPDVLKWMDENLDWTTQLGHAYLAQPNDVMDAIQELRAKAQDVGNLVDTPQQRIVREEQYIRIVPAEPDYVYVPYYDPAVVYYERPVEVPLLTFGPRWLTGWWLCFDFDWRRHHLYCGDWDGGWDYHHDHDRYDYYGERVYINEQFTNYRVWEGDRHRRLASVRSLADAGNRRRALAKPERFTERPQLASKVERTLSKRENRWAKRAVSSGLAEKSVLDEKESRERRSRDREETAQMERPEVSDALVGKGRRDTEGKGRVEGVPGKDGKSGKDRVTLPKGEAPVSPGVAEGKSGKGRGAEDAKGKDRVTLPKGEAPVSPGVAEGKSGRGRGAEDAKGKDRVVTPKSEAPSVPGSKAGKGKDGPRTAADIEGSLSGKDTPPTRAPEVKGKGSGRVAKPGAPPSVPQARPKPSEGPSVTKETVSPKQGPRPNFQKSAPPPKPRPMPSVTKSSPKPSSVPPPSVKQSAPRPKVSASKPQSPPRPKVSASKPQGPPRPKVSASKPQGPPRPKVSASKPQGPPRSKPVVKQSAPRPKVSAPRPSQGVKKSAPKPSSKPSAPKGGGGDTKKKKKK